MARSCRIAGFAVTGFPGAGGHMNEAMFMRSVLSPLHPIIGCQPNLPLVTLPTVLPSGWSPPSCPRIHASVATALQEEGSKQENEHGVHGLKPAGWECERAEVEACVLIGENGHGASGLLVSHPEEDDEEEDNE